MQLEVDASDELLEQTVGRADPDAPLVSAAVERHLLQQLRAVTDLYSHCNLQRNALTVCHSFWT